MMKKIEFNSIGNELIGSAPEPISFDKNKFFNKKVNDNKNNISLESSANLPSSFYLNKNENKSKKKKINLNEKNEVMNLISMKDFKNGFWNINPKTNKIKI